MTVEVLLEEPVVNESAELVMLLCNDISSNIKHIRVGI